MDAGCNTLSQRAAMLAQLPEQVSAEKTIQVVEFLLANEIYAFDLKYVKKVLPLKEAVALPGAPPFVYGITNYMGQIVTVLDLRKFFDLPIRSDESEYKILILQAKSIQLAVIAEEIVGVKDCATAQLQTELPTLSGVRARYLKGVSAQQTIVLDVVSLLDDESLIV